MKNVTINKLVSILAVLAVALTGGTLLSVRASESQYPDAPVPRQRQFQYRQEQYFLPTEAAKAFLHY